MSFEKRKGKEGKRERRKEGKREREIVSQVLHLNLG